MNVADNCQGGVQIDHVGLIDQQFLHLLTQPQHYVLRESLALVQLFDAHIEVDHRCRLEPDGGAI